jgi:outer membrane lipoprotein SlyB
MRTAVFVLLTAVLLGPACATTSATSSTWAEPPAGTEWERNGKVEWIHETIQQEQGNPGAGAAAGAVMGGLLGAALTGRGIGALFGAASGAIVGAGTSQGYREHRTYDVLVHFDDGEERTFRYHGYPPFRPGQLVSLTPHGLVAEVFAVPPPYATVPPPSSSGPQARALESAAQPPTAQPREAPPPPPAAPAPPTAQSQTQQPATPAGQWSFTQQYGWVWMPYGVEYAFTPDYDNGEPYMYVYAPEEGWTWVAAPWLWGWGPVPFLGVGGGARFGWYGHGWGEGWHGARPAHYRGLVHSFGRARGFGGRHR